MEDPKAGREEGLLFLEKIFNTDLLLGKNPAALD